MNCVRVEVSGPASPTGSCAFLCDLEASGKAGRAYDRDLLCPRQVPVLPGFPAGVSAAVPDPQLHGRLLWAPQSRVGRLGFLEQGVEPGVEQKSH